MTSDDLLADGGQCADDTDRTECTDKTCSGEAKHALWMGGEFSRVADAHPSFSYDDGDLHPHVCDECLPRYEDLHGDKGEFVRPGEKLLADGGQCADATDRVMVDIETLGLEPGAVILSLGAVRFDKNGVSGTFSRSIDRESCEDAGMHVDEDTLSWWEGQEPAARAVLTGGDDIESVLVDFAAWFDTADEIWANSPAFDCEHLEMAYDAVGLVEPWEFYQERDVRTLKELPIAPELEQDGTEHDALDDAKYQARVVSETLQSLHAIAEQTEVDR